MSKVYVFPGLKERSKQAVIRRVRVEQHSLTDLIPDVICRHYGLTFDELLRPNRKADVAFARHLIAAVLHDRNLLSKERISEKLHRDHSTILNSIRTIANWRDTGYRKDEIDLFFNYDYHAKLKKP